MRVLLTGAFLIAGLSMGASETRAQMPITLKGGLNLTNFVGGDAGDTDREEGLNLGASIGLVRVSRVQVLAEVYYRQKGASGSLTDLGPIVPPAGGSTPTSQNLEVGLDYVEIPVVARIDLGKPTGSWFPYLFGGPAFGWRVDCSVALESGTSETKCDDLTENLEQTIRDYDLGMVIGAGLDYALPRGIGALNLDARYTGGLSKIGDGDEALDIRNQAFSVMLGWSFAPPGMNWGAGR